MRKKILITTCLYLLISFFRVEAAYLQELGPERAFKALELNDNGLITARREESKVTGGRSRLIRNDKDSGMFEVIDQTFSYHHLLFTCKFENGELMPSPTNVTARDNEFPDGTIHLNAHNFVVVHSENSPTLTVIYPNGVRKNVSLLSQDDSVYYLDDRGNIVLRRAEGSYYSINTSNLAQYFYRDFRLENLEKEYLACDYRFKTLHGKKLPSMAQLNAENPDRSILLHQIVLANNNDQYVVRGKWRSGGEFFLFFMNRR
jgi:hypothetical protein